AFLMDEPLSNLDAKLRIGMRAELARLHERLGTTTVYVTHDQTEAMTLGQRVAVMRDGRIQQVDEPQVLYRRPANLFVGAFIGAPKVDVADLRAARDDEDESLLADSGALFNARVNPRTAARRGAPLHLSVDPAELYFFDPATGENLLAGSPEPPSSAGPGDGA